MVKMIIVAGMIVSLISGCKNSTVGVAEIAGNTPDTYPLQKNTFVKVVNSNFKRFYVVLALNKLQCK